MSGRRSRSCVVGQRVLALQRIVERERRHPHGIFGVRLQCVVACLLLRRRNAIVFVQAERDVAPEYGMCRCDRTRDAGGNSRPSGPWRFPAFLSDMTPMTPMVRRLAEMGDIGPASSSSLPAWIHKRQLVSVVWPMHMSQPWRAQHGHWEPPIVGILDFELDAPTPARTDTLLPVADKLDPWRCVSSTLRQAGYLGASPLDSR